MGYNESLGVEYMDDKITYWLDLAKYDIESAKVMQKGCRYLYVGFMCHQTIEKALKAYLTSITDEPPPYIHNLIRLSELTGLLTQFSDEQKQTVITLNPLNIEARYPIKKDELGLLLTKSFCVQLLKDTEELLKWIESKLSQ